MRRSLVVMSLGLLVLVASGYAAAQETATPTPSEELCATPSGSPAASPVAVEMATAVHVPGAQEGPAPSPTLLFPCATPGATPAASGETVEIEVVMVDIDFLPEALTIPANTDVVVHLPNEGVIPHNFKIDDPEYFSGDVPPGETVDLTINLPPGEYEYYCMIPGHKPAGMVGTLTAE